MPRNEWVALINSYAASSTKVGVAYKESVTLTDISPGAGTEKAGALILPANYLVVGSIIRWTAMGWFGTTAKPLLTLGLYCGAVAGKPFAETAALETPETVTELPWELNAITRITAIGEGATPKAITQGMVTGVVTPKATEKVTATTSQLPATKPQTEKEVGDLTTPKALTLGAKWGTSNAANTITCTTWLVELLN